jgi:ankyrin repeat protein
MSSKLPEWAGKAIAAIRRDCVTELRRLLTENRESAVLISCQPDQIPIHVQTLFVDFAIFHKSSECCDCLFNERFDPLPPRRRGEEEDSEEDGAWFEGGTSPGSWDSPEDAVPVPPAALHDLLAETQILVRLSISGWLWQSDIPLKSRPRNGYDAFYLAANSGRRDLIVYMLDGGCEPTQISAIGTTVYNVIVMKNNVELLELFIERGIPVTPAANGRWPLHCAVKARHAELIERLIESTDSDPNCADRRGDTPLHLAAQLGLPAFCEMLVGFGADVDRRNRAGYTALHVAAVYGKLRAVEALAAAGAYLAAIDSLGRTALNLAVIRKRRQVVRWFEDQGLTNDNMTEMPPARRKRKRPSATQEEKDSKKDKRKVQALVKTLR